jgi:hypothetical protein
MADDSSPFDGFTSLLRLTGTSVPARALFVGEATFSGIYTGTTIGLVCGQLGMLCTPFGPLIPFLCGSSLGFCIGLYSAWTRALERTYIYANHYPHILAHALWTDSRIIVPPNVLPPIDSANANVVALQSSSMLADWVQRQNIRELSLCVLAAQTCQKDVNEVDQLVRQRLIEETVSMQNSNESSV